MAKAISSEVPLGTPMPDAQLLDGNGQRFSLNSCYGDGGLLVMFICNHCPFVQHIAPFLPTLSQRLSGLGVHAVAINSSDLERYPDDAPAAMVNFSEQHRFPFPYLFDETQAVARAFRADCTPDFYLFDAKRTLFYHGQLDESRPGVNSTTDGRDLLDAATRLHAGKPAPQQQMPSLGCSIEWKKSVT